MSTVLLMGCEETEDTPLDEPETLDLSAFPDFITSNENYFITRIGSVPEVEIESYHLIIDGSVGHPDTLELSELNDLPQQEVLLTIECIGNPGNGSLVSTARWRGFDLYQLLSSKGISSAAEAVKVHCADGYYVTYPMDQVQSGSMIGALHMNDEILPVLHGYPLRIIIPGYYGVKQPAWVTRLEVLEQAGDDFWNQYNWDTSPSMPIDSKIIFPWNGHSYQVGDTLEVRGTAYGGRKVASISITLDDGISWVPSTILKQEEMDHVWVFWQAQVVLGEAGQIFIRSRAIDSSGNIQPMHDDDHLDGTDLWGGVRITVADSSQAP